MQVVPVCVGPTMNHASPRAAVSRHWSENAPPPLPDRLKSSTYLQCLVLSWLSHRQHRD